MIGCYAQTQVHSDKLKDVDLSKYESYAWLPSPDTGSSAIYDNDILQTNLMGEIDEQMAMRGYTHDNDNPDLLVLMRVMFERETDVYRDPIYSSYNYVYPGLHVVAGYPYYYRSYNGYGYIQGYDIDTVKYTEGTVVVDIIESGTKRLLWRGWSDRLINAANYKSNLRNDIDRIFEEYPVTIDNTSSSAKSGEAWGDLNHL